MPDRRARGAVFTPAAIAAHLAVTALGDQPRVATVCDPAAGDGRLLAAVADVVIGDQLGSQPVRFFAADIDQQAWGRGPLAHQPHTRFVRADSLQGGLGTWSDAPPEGFDLVIGNPPFRNQLERTTALPEVERTALRERYGAVAGGYADTAAMFLVNACEMTARDGRIAMIMPLAFLTARDAAPARRRVLELAQLSGLWLARSLVFPDAAVQVCALILDRRRAGEQKLRRWVGPNWDSHTPLTLAPGELETAETWGHLTAGLIDGAPEVDLVAGRRLGDLVTATAGFRSQFYGLAPLVQEAPDATATARRSFAPMITAGLIEPGRVAWGERGTRIAGSQWTHPVVDRRRLEAGSALHRWVTERLVPKLVVATQTRVVEAVADPAGEWIPSTPVIAVHGPTEELWRALAVLLAPPVTAWARQRFIGAALSIDALKLSARQVLDIPLPVDEHSWESAAAMLSENYRRAHGGNNLATVDRVAAEMTVAYRADPAVHRWWQERVGL